MSASNAKKANAEQVDSLTYQQAAVRLGVSPITLRRWRAEGRFKVRQFSSTLIRIPVAEIERLENEALSRDEQSEPSLGVGLETNQGPGLHEESKAVAPEDKNRRSYERLIAFKTASQARLLFAGQAMQALIARGENLSAKNRGVLARMAFQVADQMVEVSREGVDA